MSAGTSRAFRWPPKLRPPAVGQFSRRGTHYVPDQLAEWFGFVRQAVPLHVVEPVAEGFRERGVRWTASISVSR